MKREKKYKYINVLKLNCQNTRIDGSFWATGYYCGTAGHVSADQVARYIFDQTKNLRKKMSLFDLQPFEYDIADVKKQDTVQTQLDAFGIGGFDSALRSA
jgi:hypothetical protein